MNDQREEWRLGCLATLGIVEAALLIDEGGRRWTVLGTPGLIHRVQHSSDPTEALFGPEDNPRPIEQLSGWPEDFTEVEERVVEAFQRDEYDGEV